MFSKHSEVCVGIVCALSAAIAQAQTVSNWTSNSSGIWNDPDHWFPVVPDATVDAKHLKKLNHIQVAGDRECLSFEGAGGAVDRFLLIQSTNGLSVGSGGMSVGVGIGTGGNFAVKLENGTALDPTTISVDGFIDGIDFVSAQRQEGNNIDISYDGFHGIRNCSIALGDNVKLLDLSGDGGAIDSTSVSLGDDCEIRGIGTDVVGPGDHSVSWNVGNRGDIKIVSVGNAGGVVPGFASRCIRGSGQRVADIHERL